MSRRSLERSAGRDCRGTGTPGYQLQSCSPQNTLFETLYEGWGARLGAGGLCTTPQGSHDGPPDGRTLRAPFIQAEGGLRSLLHASSHHPFHRACGLRTGPHRGPGCSVSGEILTWTPFPLRPTVASKASGPLLGPQPAHIRIPYLGTSARWPASHTWFHTVHPSRTPRTWSPFTPLSEAGPAPRIAPEGPYFIPGPHSVHLSAHPGARPNASRTRVSPAPSYVTQWCPGTEPPGVPGVGVRAGQDRRSRPGRLLLPGSDDAQPPKLDQPTSQISHLFPPPPFLGSAALSEMPSTRSSGERPPGRSPCKRPAPHTRVPPRRVAVPGALRSSGRGERREDCQRMPSGKTQFVASFTSLPVGP